MRAYAMHTPVRAIRDAYANAYAELEQAPWFARPPVAEPARPEQGRPLVAMSGLARAGASAARPPPWLDTVGPTPGMHLPGPARGGGSAPGGAGCPGCPVSAIFHNAQSL